MRTLLMLGSLSFLSVAAIATEVRAWSLKTHVWIAQEVLNDLLPDGKVTIAGKDFAVPSHVVDALRSSPERYRMGHMGPDVFPDPIVGQVTTHPGLDGGWQTDDWLKHLMKKATTNEEIAFAYGFTGHAAGDIFAHSYVNAYAGDIFQLADEREVERRHFLLEKYIESRTPMPRSLAGVPLDWRRDLGTATSFLRDALILNNGASGQNSRAGFGLHLSSMNEVYNAVGTLDEETQKVIQRLTGWGADYLNKKAEISIRLATAKDGLKLAELSVEARLEILAVKRQALELAIKAAVEARDLIKNYPELLGLQTQLLAEQLKILADATAFATRVAAEVAQAISDLQSAISDLRGKVVGLACYALVWPPAIKRCQRAVNDLNGRISDLEGSITGQRAALELARRARDVAEANVEGTKRFIDNLKDRFLKAQQDILSGALDGAIVTARASLEIEERLLLAERKVVEEAKKIQEKIEAELLKVTDLIDIAKKAIDRYNILTLLIENWRSDIRTATEEYIKASDRAGHLMLTNGGNPLSEYKEWFECYGQVFLAQPKQIGQAGCLLRQFVQELKNDYDRIIDGLPEILRWIIAPSREIEKIVRAKIEPELRKAEFRIVGYLTDPTTAEFLRLLSDPASASRDKLVEVYRADASNKRLLLFNDVAQLIDRDFPDASGVPDPQKFNALTHALTLAKLALLGPDELNDVIKSFVGEYVSPRYGATVYSSAEPHFSILFDVVRSIDGNHQWQAYGLPYPRRGEKHDSVGKFPYGHNHRDDPTKGLRIWVDPYLRERVFLALFPTDITGEIGRRAEMQWSDYRFPACAAHPFPVSQEVNGGPAANDRRCVDLAKPGIPSAAPSWTDAKDYGERFFRCYAPVLGDRHWVIVASLTTRRAALRKAEAIRAANPDMQVEAWEPLEGNRYWPVMIAACAEADAAVEARDVAIRRGIARDAFIWRSRAPWRRISSSTGRRPDAASRHEG